MDKNLRVNRIFRILAGMYLLYLSTSIWREIDTSSNKIIGIAFIILFSIIGVVFIILSARDLINMKKESAEETEEITEEKDDTTIDEIIEKKDDTEDFDSDESKTYDEIEATTDMELDPENDISDDGVDDSSDINTIDNIKDHTKD